MTGRQRRVARWITARLPADLVGCAVRLGQAYGQADRVVRWHRPSHGAELGQGAGVQVALAERDRHAGEVLPLGEQHPVWPGRGDGEGVLAVEGDPEARPAKPAQIKTWIDGLDSQGEGSGRLPAAARQSAWASAPNASLGSQPSPSYPVPAPPGSIFTTP